MRLSTNLDFSICNENNEENIVSSAWRSIWRFILLVMGIGALILILVLVGPLFLSQFSLDLS